MRGQAVVRVERCQLAGHTPDMVEQQLHRLSLLQCKLPGCYGLFIHLTIMKSNNFEPGTQGGVTPLSGPATSRDRRGQAPGERETAVVLRLGGHRPVLATLGIVLRGQRDIQGLPRPPQLLGQLTADRAV